MIGGAALWLVAGFGGFASVGCTGGGVAEECDDGTSSEDGCFVEDTDTPAAEVPRLTELPAPRLLRRISLDLRGVLPSIEDLDAVEADGAALDGLLDTYLEDDRLEPRLVHLLGERWHTRIDEFLILFMEYPPLSSEVTKEYSFERGVGEEPLRLMARVIADDRPWGEVVTADWTMANDLLESIWPLELDDAQGEGWRPAHYTDGRPAAGVLSTNGLWWRYYTTTANYNRSRVAAITRLLICQDYLSRPVSFSSSPSLADAEGTEEALRSDPYCMGCHSSIDPIASTLFGFWVINEYNISETDYYHPEREAMGPMLTGYEPAWFGTPLNGLSDLGQAIAVDERFSACAAETFASLLWRREVELEDFDRIEALRQALVAADMQIKPLIREIVATNIYRANGLDELATEMDEERENTLRILTPDQLASAIEDLTGFVWTYEGFAQMDNDTWGYRIMAGGVNGVNVTRPQDTPSLTWELTVRRLAQASASYAVQQGDLLSPASEFTAPILDGVTPETIPGDEAFSEWLDATYWRLYGERPDEEWHDAAEHLWTEISIDGPEQAWIGLLSVMLRDPLFVTY